MRILIAADEAVSRKLLELKLGEWGHEVVVCQDGRAALDHLVQRDGPSIGVLDWMMPQLSGVAVCREVRANPDTGARYLILLTSKTDRREIVEGLHAGADDYVTKPFDHAQLEARVAAGVRVIRLQEALATRLTELEAALANVRQLQGLLPICAYCRKVRDDGNYWSQVETYISDHTDVRFSHGICPDCLEKAIAEVDRESEDPRR